jgi:preprotein translocase subunit YajC
MLTMILWMVLFVGLMYFLLIRPQKKQRQEHEKFLSGLKKGDRVVTSGGILGTIKGITSTVVTLDLGEGVSMRVRKEGVTGLQTEPAGEAAKSESKEN